MTKITDASMDLGLILGVEIKNIKIEDNRIMLNEETWVGKRFKEDENSGETTQ